MSLQNPSQKMSKSDANQNSYIALLDCPDVVLKKLKRAVTDSDAQIKYDPENKPGLSNLLALYSCISNDSIDKIVENYQGKGYGAIKQDLAELISNTLAPIQQQFKSIREDNQMLFNILKEGQQKAQAIAQVTLSQVKKAIGLTLPL